MMRERTGWGARVAPVAALLVACFSGSGNTPGTFHGPCYPNDTCNAGLVCVDDVCLHAPDAAPPDAWQAPDAWESPPDAYEIPPDAWEPPPDAAGFQCGADAVLEPNESIYDPTPTPIPDFGDSYELNGMQICPYTDIDVFHVLIDVTGKDLAVTLTHNSSQGLLAFDLLDSDGSLLLSATPSGSADTLVVEAQDLAAASYFVEVWASGYGIQNNYDIEFVTGNL